MSRSRSGLWRLLGRVAVGLAVLMLLPYAWAPVYRFPEPVAFAGPEFWNPYASTSGHWQRANLHAHGRAWLGLTSGEQSDADVANRRSEPVELDPPQVSKHGVPVMHNVGAQPPL